MAKIVAPEQGATRIAFTLDNEALEEVQFDAQGVSDEIDPALAEGIVAKYPLFSLEQSGRKGRAAKSQEPPTAGAEPPTGAPEPTATGAGVGNE